MSSYAESASRAATDRPVAGSLVETARQKLVTHGPALAGYGIPFLLVLYLALRKGGYDPVVRGEIGFILWWIVLFGAMAAVLPVARLPRRAWVGLGFLLAFGLWTTAGVFWSESVERTVNESARVATLLAVTSLALLAQGRNSLRRTVSASGAAVAVVALFALLSRLDPGLFSQFDPEGLLAANGYRLSQPVGYWNGLAALLALGLPLVTWSACHGRTIAFRSLMAASIPVLGVALYYTFSRGGVAASAIGLLALLFLHPRRLELIVKSVPAVLGTAIAVIAASNRPELADAIMGATYDQQASAMFAIILAVAAGVGLIQAALTLAERHGLGPRLRPSRIVTAAVAGALLVSIGGVAIAADAPGRADSAWQTFKSEGGPGTGQARLDSSSGNGRYQYWKSSLDAHSTKPTTGRGPGTFEYWWSRNATIPGFVRQAHSLYLQLLAETGTVGLALILGLFATILGTGVVQALRKGSTSRRSQVAAATAGFLTFAATAAVDWSWELTVIPVAALLLAAAILGPDSRSRRSRRTRFKPVTRRVPLTIGIAAVAVPCLALLLVSFTSGQLLERSQAQFRQGDVSASLESARAAAAIQPYAASPKMQEALVLSAAGDDGRALIAARKAVRAEPTNWRTWFVRMETAARTGRAGEALRSYRRARDLNPRSRLFRVPGLPPKGS